MTTTKRERRLLDAQVAEQVMGWTDIEIPAAGGIIWGAMPGTAGRITSLLPHYSSVIESAWEVVEKLRQAGWLVVIKTIPDGFPFRGAVDSNEQFPARVAVELTWMPQRTPEDSRRSITLRPFAFADTMPEAVCKAALVAVKQLERYG